MTPIAKVLDALERHGCDPRQIGPGVWLAICPACRARGRDGLLTVREIDGRVCVGCGEHQESAREIDE